MLYKKNRYNLCCWIYDMITMLLIHRCKRTMPGFTCTYNLLLDASEEESSISQFVFMCGETGALKWDFYAEHEFDSQPQELCPLVALAWIFSVSPSLFCFPDLFSDLTFQSVFLFVSTFFYSSFFLLFLLSPRLFPFPWPFSLSAGFIIIICRFLRFGSDLCWCIFLFPSPWFALLRLLTVKIHFWLGIVKLVAMFQILLGVLAKVTLLATFESCTWRWFFRKVTLRECVLWSS